jgi:hypothetical protein
VFTDAWVVIEAGQGMFQNESERQAAITYRNPDP